MEPSGSPTIHGPPNRVSLSVDGSDARNFDFWQSGYSPLYAMDASTKSARPSFRAGLTSDNLAGLVIIDGHSSAEILKRTAQTIARSGVDHISLTVYSEGGCDLDTDGHAAEVLAGDVFFLDMTRRSALRSSDYKSLTLVLPRELLASQVADLDGLHGKILPGTSPLAIMLAAHMRMVHAQAPSLRLSDVHAATRGTTALVGKFAGASADGQGVIAQVAAGASLRACRQMIDAHLRDPDLGPEFLCRELGVSRTKLYRMFEPLGGVSEHIQQRRLMRAYRAIVDPAHVHERINAIAARCGFSNASVFNRAFRQAYGMSPTELRIVSTRGQPDDAVLSGERGYRTMQRWLLGMDATVA